MRNVKFFISATWWLAYLCPHVSNSFSDLPAMLFHDLHWNKQKHNEAIYGRLLFGSHVFICVLALASLRYTCVWLFLMGCLVYFPWSFCCHTLTFMYEGKEQCRLYMYVTAKHSVTIEGHIINVCNIVRLAEGWHHSAPRQLLTVLLMPWNVAFLHQMAAWASKRIKSPSRQEGGT